MWRMLLATGLLLAGLGPTPAPAQHWTGTAGLTLSGGSQTNLYLDPVLNTWNPDIEPAFGALTPRMGLSYTASRLRFDVTGRTRLHPRRTENPQLSQGTLQLRLRLHPDWAVGASGGGQRFRFETRRARLTTRRDSWWALPFLQWTPTPRTMLTLRGGFTQRYERSFEPTDRQTSGLVSLRLTHWPTDRVRARARTFFSSGTTSTADVEFGSLGGSLALKYWPTPALSFEGTLTAEQPRFETVQSADGMQELGTVRDHIGRAGLEVEWAPRSSVTLFGRTEGLYSDLETGDTSTDVHVSAGVRLQVQGVLGDTSAELPRTRSPRRRVCRSTEEGVRLQVPYDGPGTPHVTGDFNGWALPGIPLTPNDDHTWSTHITLPPGRYEYRLRIVENGAERWANLPAYAQTTEGSFGDTNGICIVH